MKMIVNKFASKFILVLAGVAVLSSIAALGQVIKGSISGTVVDAQDAVIAGAQVKATQIDTGAVFTTTSDGSGLFRISLIPAGNYKVEITAQGFRTAVQSNVQVTAGADMGLGSVKLAVGGASETVEVTDTAPLVEASQAQVTNTFAGRTLQTFSGIQENQGLDNLALFVPGVASVRDSNFSNTNGGQGFSSNGLRGRNNDQEIDGQNNNDNGVTGPALFLSDSNFVQQYVIITNNFGPEYGRNAGSVVNIITASGTNNWHGTIYGNENNSVLNGLPADERVAGLTGPPRANDEFTGFTVGGPWIKNKLFFFGGFDNEIVATSTDFISPTLTPTPAGLATLGGCFPSGQSAIAVGNLTKFGPYGISAGNPTPGTLTTTNIVDPFTGNTLCSGVQEATVSRLLPTNTHDYNFVIREDWQATANDTVSGRYIYSRTDPQNLTIGASASEGYPVSVPALSQIVLISETHNFSPRMVNEARVGFDRLNVQFGTNTIGNTVPGIGQLPNALTQIAFSNAVDTPFGVPNGFPQGRFSNTWQVQDNWNYVLGKHQLKAGVNYTHEQAPNTFLPSVDGQYNFANLSAYIVNQPSTVDLTLANPEIGFKEDDTFLYVGDDWKIAKNLTLNLGVTWSYFSQPVNLLNQLSTQNETGPNPLFNPALPLSLRTFPAIPAYKNTVGPSFGFAYSPQWGGFLTGRGKTVIRGGYRLSYDPPNLNIFLNNYDSAPSVLAATIGGANFAAGTPAPANLQVPSNPTGPNVRNLVGASIPVGTLDPRVFPQASLPTNFRPDHVQSWSLGVERQMGRNSALELRYVGDHGSDLFQNINANPLIGPLAANFPNVIPAGVTPCAAPGFVGANGISAVGRENCNEGLVQQRTNGGFSNYDALQVNYRATNLFHQLTMTAAYTYSKTLDNSGEIFQTFSAGNSTITPQNPFNTKGAEYSRSGLDFPNNFTVQLTEQLPFFKEQHGFLGHLLGGWSGAISYIYASGQNYTPFMVALADATDIGSGLGDIFDTTFEAAFNNAVGYARPFLGNSHAPITSVGIFCGDVLGPAGCTGAGFAANQLLSLNALNANGSTVAVTNQQVRFIANTAMAQQIFGTPFGNVPRNYLRDAPSNTGNVSIYKNFKINERVSFEFHTTMLNAFNHSNFQGVTPFVETAGTTTFGSVFATPSQDIDLANGLTNGLPGQTLNATRRIYFGGTIRF